MESVAPLTRRHGDHGHGHEEDEGNGHGHGGNQDSMRHHTLASLYWYGVSTVLILGLAARLLSAWIARQRIKRGPASPSMAERLLEGPKSAIATSFLYRGRSSWLVTLPWEKAFIVIVYAAFVSFLLTYKAIKHDGNFQERLGFRAAWITVTQTAMPFLLAARVNPIGLILGTSYERVNWFHRWASRIFIASATVHGAFFVTEWVAADFFWEELRTVSMVKHGIFAWVILVWTLFSSSIPARRWRYEFFVAQHILSTVSLLAFLLLHVPGHHLFSVWCAVVAFAFDVVTRSLNPVWRNIRLRMPSGAFGRIPRYAFRANVDAVDQDLTVVTVKDVSFKWTPGQHILIWTPEFWKQSPHPFTIADVADPTLPTQDIQLTIKTKSGITRALNQWARQTAHDDSMRLWIAGPYGCLPNWRQFDNLVLIAASTGGSFTTPVLEDLLTCQSPGCLRKISALYIARRKAHVEPYLSKIARTLTRAKELGIAVRIAVAITQTGKEMNAPAVDESSKRLLDQTESTEETPSDDIELSRLSLDSIVSSTSGRSEQLLKEEMNLALDSDVAYDRGFIEESIGRPDIEAYIRTAVGSVPGSVAVAVCAGTAIENKTEQAVAPLRYERASQGLDSQSIFLHIERAAG